MFVNVLATAAAVVEGGRVALAAADDDHRDRVATLRVGGDEARRLGAHVVEHVRERRVHASGSVVASRQDRTGRSERAVENCGDLGVCRERVRFHQRYARWALPLLASTTARVTFHNPGPLPSVGND